MLRYYAIVNYVIIILGRKRMILPALGGVEGMTATLIAEDLVIEQ